MLLTGKLRYVRCKLSADYTLSGIVLLVLLVSTANYNSRLLLAISIQQQECLTSVCSCWRVVSRLLLPCNAERPIVFGRTGIDRKELWECIRKTSTPGSGIISTHISSP